MHKPTIALSALLLAMTSSVATAQSRHKTQRLGPSVATAMPERNANCAPDVAGPGPMR